MDNLSKYRQIIQNYKNGKYGNELLSLYDILLRENEVSLLDELSLDELNELIDSSFGIHKLLFISYRNKLINKDDNTLKKKLF